MTSWQPHQRLLIYLLLALALACAISPVLSLGVDWFMTQWPALMPKRIPLHRTFDRAFMIAGILLFILGRRVLIPAQLRKLLRVGAASARRDLATGLCLALGSMLLVVAAMTVTEVFTPFFRLTRSVAIGRVASAAAAGIFAGVFEENIFSRHPVHGATRP
jgi:hypothetical protein